MGPDNLPILHIGYPKTGTTWFQKKFYPKVDNIFYIDHNSLIEIIGGKQNRLAGSKSNEKLLFIKKKIIVCDENMLGSASEIKNNAHYYKEVFGNSIIILFIRNQVDKLLSNYSEYIKAGGTLKLNQFLFNADNSIYGGHKHLYHNAIGVYKEVFGEDNVHIYLYEDFKASPKHFIENFINKYNLEINAEKLSFAKVNKQLSRNLLTLKRFSNQLTKSQDGWLKGKRRSKFYLLHLPYWFTLSKKIFIVLNLLSFGHSKTKIERLIRKENLDRITSYYKTSNQLLVNNHNVKGLDKYNYPL